MEKFNWHWHTDFTSIRTHYCFNVAFFTWPHCRAIYSCSHDKWDVMSHCIASSGIPRIHSRNRCFKSSLLARPCFVCLAFDVVPKGVWYCKRVRRTGWWQRNEKWVCLQTLSRQFAWKCVLCEHLLQTSLCMKTASTEAQLIIKVAFQISSTQRRLWHTCCVRWHDPAESDCLFWGYVESKTYETRPGQSLWLKTANLWVYSRDLWKNYTPWYSFLFILGAIVCWMTWWSPTKCHIHTVILSMNSHGRELSTSVNKMLPV